jgi:hypothetical protein
MSRLYVGDLPRTRELVSLREVAESVSVARAPEAIGASAGV